MVTNNEKQKERELFSARFNLVLDMAGIPPKGQGRQGAVAKIFGVSDKGARKWLVGESIPNKEKLIAIVNKFKETGVTFEWLMMGDPNHLPDFIEGEVVRQKLPDPSIKQPSDKERTSHPELKPVEIVAWENPEDLPDDQYAIIPRVRLKLSAGNGTMITEELPDAPLAFTTEWIKRKRVKRSNLVIVNATGDSMEPTICCGALLLIDTASTEIIDGKVYALRYGDELRVKRLYKRYDGGIIIRSDNSSKYPDETLTASDLNEHIYVIGRVIWQAGDL